MSDFNVKHEILSAIGKEDDPRMKTILLLMLGVLEEIGSKIDAVVSNEAALRVTVLNGHAAYHDKDHDFLKEVRSAWQSIIDTRDMVEHRMANGGHCEWASKKIAEEKQEAIDNADSKRRIRDAVIEKIVIGLVSSISTALGLFIFFSGT